MDGVFLEQDGGLIAMEHATFDKEADLQSLLEHYPGLLSGRQVDQGQAREWLLVSREQGVPAEQDGPDRWSADHLFLDQDGVPTIVEVKRSTNTQIRREVVGQMLDYAANGVRYWPVERLQSDLVVRTGGSEQAESAVIDLLTRSGQNASPEEFWRQVESNLQAGHLRLLFVADIIPESLQRIIEFLNEQMTQCEVLGVEIRQYVAGGSPRVLTPTVIGQTSQSRRTKRHTDTRTFDELLAEASEAVREVGRRLDTLADARKWEVKTSRVGRQYCQDGWTLVQFYPGEAGGVLQLMFAAITERDPQESADLLGGLEEIAGRSLTRRQPKCPVEPLLERWDRFAEDWLPRYADAVARASATSAGSSQV